MRPTRIKQLQRRSCKLRVRRIDKFTVTVESANNPQSKYIVSVKFERHNTVHTRCTCPWAQHEGVACAHVMAALDFLAATKGRKLSFWLSEEAAKRQVARHSIHCTA